MSIGCVRVGFVVVALAATGAGNSPRTTSGERVGEQDTADSRRLREQAFALYQTGEYAKAAGIYRAEYEAARSRGAQRTAARLLNNLAGTQFALLRYREALETYLEARKSAAEAGDAALAATLSVNLSSLYLQLNEPTLAREALERATSSADQLTPQSQASLLLQQMAVEALEGDLDKVKRTFSDALWWADRAGQVSLQAQAWNNLGWTLLRAGDLDAADQALTEAFRLRRLHEPTAAASSYVRLSSLRLAQGNPGAALAFANLALGASPAGSAEPSWVIHYQRGLAHRGLNQLREALGDFRRAIELTRRWRVDVAGAERLRTGAEVRLHDIYADYIDLTSRLYVSSGDGALALESLEAAEHSRSAAWRELLEETQTVRRRLPEAYYETLAKLRAAETGLRARPTAALRGTAERLNLDLVEMEEKAGLVPPSSMAPKGRLLESIQESLGDDVALFSFYIGEKSSHLWVVTRREIEFHEIAPRRVLEDLVWRFRDEIARGGDVEESGSRLYSALFSPASAGARSRPRWRLVLDRGLFDLPVAALVVGRDGGRPKYLVEERTVELVPSAFVAGLPPLPRTGRGFVGLGDPVYNTADPRMPKVRRSWAEEWLAKPSGEEELPRLVGSEDEINNCAKAFDRPEPVLLTGTEATLERLQRVAEKGAGAIHLATHVVPSTIQPDQALLVLSLRSPHGVELATPSDVAAMRVRADVVVLSGCSSGRGRNLPGVGVMGLTRSWLIAGAGSVVATLWPVPDGNGELFQGFYRDFGKGSAAAAALRTAQTEMAASGGWRSKPRYWAAYFAVGRN